jgi:NitT/TauT family transport system substrate-binding protein
MARLTPFAKILISVIVIGGASAIGYNLIKNRSASNGAPTVAASTSADKGAAAAQPYVPPSGKADGKPMLRLGINSFHGFAPGLVANGNSLRTKPGSIFAKEGLDLEFVIQDDIPTLDTVFTSGTAQCTWRTSDFWAQEQPNLRNAGLDARAIMVVDNTQGADAIITRNASIRRIEDLAGKRVALLQYTPSHGMLIDAIENSSLSARAKQSIQMVFINADEGMTGVGAALNSGAVDAAVMWDPDL